MYEWSENMNMTVGKMQKMEILRKVDISIDEFIESLNWPEDSQIIEARQKQLNVVKEGNALKKSSKKKRNLHLFHNFSSLYNYHSVPQS